MSIANDVAIENMKKDVQTLLARSPVDVSEIIKRLDDLENKYRMLNARISRGVEKT